MRKLKKKTHKNTEVIEEVSLEAYYLNSYLKSPELIVTFLLSCRCTTWSDQFPTLRKTQVEGQKTETQVSALQKYFILSDIFVLLVIHWQRLIYQLTFETVPSLKVN